MIARRFIKHLSADIAQRDDYRLYPAYAVGLVAVLLTLQRWPLDVRTQIAHPPLLFLESYSYQAGYLLALGLGIVSLFRPLWAARALGAAAAVVAVKEFAFWSGWNLTPGSHTAQMILYWLFDVPMSRAEHVAGEDPGKLTALYGAYALALYLMLRPFRHSAMRGIRGIEGWLLRRYPAAQRFARPVL